MVLDETLVMRELNEFFKRKEINTFLRKCVGSNICCVSAQLLVASGNARQQLTHRDHPQGYGKYAVLVFTMDARPVDTLVQHSDTTLRPARCNTLIYDGHHPHAGPAGPSQNKVFVGFSNPNHPEYRSIAREHNHGKKRQYPRLI